MPHSYCGHPSMEGDGDDEVPDHREPADTCLHVLAEETAYRLVRRGQEGGREEGY